MQRRDLSDEPICVFCSLRRIRSGNILRFGIDLPHELFSIQRLRPHPNEILITSLFTKSWHQRISSTLFHSGTVAAKEKKESAGVCGHVSVCNRVCVCV